MTVLKVRKTPPTLGARRVSRERLLRLRQLALRRVERLLRRGLLERRLAELLLHHLEHGERISVTRTP